MKKITVHDDDEFTIQYEDSQPYANCHMEVHKFSLSVMKRIEHTVGRLQREYGRDLMATSTPDDRKHHKFLKRLGFEFYRNIWKVIDGEHVVVSVWLREFRI